MMDNVKSETIENPVFEWGTNGETEKNTLIIVEGPLDVKSVIDANFPVASSFTAAIPENHLERYRELAKQYEHIAICLDTDENGYTGAYKLATDFYEHKIYNISVIDVSGKYGFMEVNKSNLNDYYKKHKEDGKTGEEVIKELLGSACNIPLFTFLSLKFLDEKGALELDKVKKMLYKPARQLGEFSILMVCHDIRFFYFPKENKNAPINKTLENCSKEEKKTIENIRKDSIKFLKKLPNILQKKPPVHVICKEILEDHTLVYSKEHGFYEYDGHTWVHRPDEIIDHYIAEALEHFIDGPFIESIEKALKTQCAKEFKRNEKYYTREFKRIETQCARESERIETYLILFEKE